MIRIKNECWEWQACKQNEGYGNFRIKNKVYKAHRISYFLTYGILSPHMHILHSCDNKRCVNPHHLSVGTDLQNRKDFYNKNPRFTKEQIKKLSQERQYGKTYTEISIKYSIPRSTVYRHLNPTNL